MSRNAILRLALACAAIGSWCLPAVAEMKQVPVVRLSVSQEVAAPPAAVWAYMTQGKNMVTWCPAWKSASNAKINIARVGDVLDFTDDWGNDGRSIVTYLAKDKELRVAHEPNDGSYLCQARIVLSASGKGTLVRYTEQYTDESKPADLEATAKKTEDGMKQTLLALKKGAERAK